jgi:hypothetical protein
MKDMKTSEESNHSYEASGDTLGGCARAHTPEQSITEKGRSPRKKLRQSLQASANTPFEARGLLSGTVIRGTPTLLNTAGNHHQHKLQRLMGTIQVKASFTQGARSRLARAQPQAGTVVPDESYVSPEGLLRQWAHPRHARGPTRAGFVEKQPWPNRLSNRPYRRRIQCEDRLTPYPNTRASVGKVEVTAVTSPFR